MSHFYITTAIDYTNASPHIGHAYEKVLADVIARYHRLRGEPTFFLTGVDQHGQKVQQAAQAAGLSPREYAEGVTTRFIDLWKVLDISYDRWAATTEVLHQRAVQGVLQKLHDAGQLYKDSHRGFYSVRQEQFLTDKERNAAGEFGEEWGEVVELEEENWYFRLSDHIAWLRQLLTQRPEIVYPGFRAAELVNALEKSEAHDLCISRPAERLQWGIPLPFDDQFVTYVWFDALLNYITFAGYGDESLEPSFASLWPAQVQLIGKDILIPAHGIYWLCMLHAIGFGDEAMPQLVVHGWWNIKGEKMSKSLGNVVDPAVLAESYGADALRYYLMRDIATGQDSDFSEGRLRELYRVDLANDLGNLLQRTASMTQRYREGVVVASSFSNEALDEVNRAALEVPSAVAGAMANYQVHQALEHIWSLIGRANQLVESQAPWKLAKDPNTSAHLDAVLFTLIDLLGRVSVLIEFVMPRTSRHMQQQLGLTEGGGLGWSDLAQKALRPRWEIQAPQPLFPRLEED